MRADISTDDIAADYRNGLSMTRIASRHDTCVAVIQARLEKAGVQPRPRSWRSDATHVSPEELQRFLTYSDPAYEARNSIADHVICKLCGRYLKIRVGYHLRDCHHISQEEYQRQFPGAHMWTFAYYAGLQQKDAQKIMEDFAADFATPKEVDDCRRDPAYEARHEIPNRIMCRRCGRWLASDQLGVHLRTHRDAAGDRLTLAKYRDIYPAAPASSYQRLAQKMGKDVRDVMEGVSDWFVTPGHLAECRQNPALESGQGITDFVVCRICGGKLMSNPTRHFRTQHGIEVEGYLELYPQAPVKVPREVRKAKAAQDNFRNRTVETLRKAAKVVKGRPGEKTHIWAEAYQLYENSPDSWSKLARKKMPKECSEKGSLKAGESLRQGVMGYAKAMKLPWPIIKRCS